MSFLDGVNGVTSKKTTTSSGSSSGFLGGIRQLDEREQKLSKLKAEAETAAAESQRLNSPASLAMETVKGIPKTVWQGAKALVDDPMRVLATPVIRAEQAIATSAGRAIGGDFGGRLERAANQPMTLPSALGGQGGTIEPQRGFDNGGAAQIAGDAAQYAATIYTGGRTKPLVDLAGKGFIKQATIQGSKEGAIGMGGYMGGGEASREGSTAGSIAMESGKGLVLGGFLGGVLGGGGAALAKPGALRAAAEAEATRMRPLPVRDDGPPPGGDINIRRIKQLPVTGGGRARNVPINRAQEPHLTDAEMPVIKMGSVPKRTPDNLPVIEAGESGPQFERSTKTGTEGKYKLKPATVKVSPAAKPSRMVKHLRSM